MQRQPPSSRSPGYPQLLSDDYRLEVPTTLSSGSVLCEWLSGPKKMYCCWFIARDILMDINAEPYEEVHRAGLEGNWVWEFLSLWSWGLPPSWHMDVVISSEALWILYVGNFYGGFIFWLCCLVSKSCLILCDPMNCSMLGFLVLYHLLKFAQTHVLWVGDAIQPSHSLLPPFPPAFNLSQHQCLFQWVSSSHQLAKVLELQHQSFQWIFRVDFL